MLSALLMRKIFVVRSHTHRTNPAEVVRALNGNTGAITALRSLMGKYVTVASDNADPGFTRKAGSTLKMIFMILRCAMPQKNPVYT